MAKVVVKTKSNIKLKDLLGEEIKEPPITNIEKPDELKDMSGL